MLSSVFYRLLIYMRDSNFKFLLFIIEELLAIFLLRFESFGSILFKLNLFLFDKNSATTSFAKDWSPHCNTWLFVVNVFILWYCSFNVKENISLYSVFYKKLTLKRSPKQEPMCFPWTTSSGEQYVPQEDSEGFAADNAYIFVLLASFVNIEPDSHA
jgi:hypothetical protein